MYSWNYKQVWVQQKRKSFSHSKCHLCIRGITNKFEYNTNEVTFDFKCHSCIRGVTNKLGYNKKEVISEFKTLRAFVVFKKYATAFLIEMLVSFVALQTSLGTTKKKSFPTFKMSFMYSWRSKICDWFIDICGLSKSGVGSDFSVA